MIWRNLNIVFNPGFLIHEKIKFAYPDFCVSLQPENDRDLRETVRNVERFGCLQPLKKMLKY